MSHDVNVTNPNFDIEGDILKEEFKYRVDATRDAISRVRYVVSFLFLMSMFVMAAFWVNDFNHQNKQLERRALSLLTINKNYPMVRANLLGAAVAASASALESLDYVKCPTNVDGTNKNKYCDYLVSVVQIKGGYENISNREMYDLVLADLKSFIESNNRMGIVRVPFINVDMSVSDVGVSGGIAILFGSLIMFHSVRRERRCVEDAIDYYRGLDEGKWILPYYINSVKHFMLFSVSGGFVINIYLWFFAFLFPALILMINFSFIFSSRDLVYEVNILISLLTSVGSVVLACFVTREQLLVIEKIRMEISRVEVDSKVK